MTVAMNQAITPKQRLRILSHRVRTTLRPLVLRGLAGLRRASPARADRWAETTARYLNSMVPPTSADVVGNYVRVLILFGVPGSSDAYKWDRFSARAIITPDTAKVPRSIHQQLLRRYEVRYDCDFEAVLAGCQEGRSGWLTPAAVDIYRKLHARGFIATVETYRDGVLVGGVWGIEVGRTLGLMSAFHVENHAGSVAWASLANIVASRGRWTTIDCGVAGNSHFERFGATDVPVGRLCERILEGLAPSRAAPSL